MQVFIHVYLLQYGGGRGMAFFCCHRYHDALTQRVMQCVKLIPFCFSSFHVHFLFGWAALLCHSWKRHTQKKNAAPGEQLAVHYSVRCFLKAIDSSYIHDHDQLVKHSFKHQSSLVCWYNASIRLPQSYQHLLYLVPFVS